MNPDDVMSGLLTLSNSTWWRSDSLTQEQAIDSFEAIRKLVLQLRGSKTIDDNPMFVAFQHQLDETPDSHATRLVFADWLEEQGEMVLANGYRWMGRNKSRPHHWKWKYQDDWHWRFDEMDGQEYYVIQSEILKAMDGDIGSEFGWKSYASRQLAETALCRALHKLNIRTTGV